MAFIIPEILMLVKSIYLIVLMQQFRCVFWLKSTFTNKFKLDKISLMIFIHETI